MRQLLGLMILTSFTLITIDYRAGANSPFRGLRSSVGTFFGPIERGVSGVVRPVGNALSTLGNVGNLNKEVRKLRAASAAVEQQRHTNEDKQRQFDDMGKLLKLVNGGQYRTIAAHVIGAAPSNFTWTVTIDAGSDRGVRKDKTVVNGDGLVGRVIEVSKFTSTVLLAIDVESTVAARLSYTGERGLVKGNGPKDMQFDVTPATTEVRSGQPVVTAGSTFVPGVPIGEVMATRAAPGDTTRSVVLKPYVNFSNLDIVGVVVQQERKTDLDALVPANPAPSPSSPAIPRCPVSTAPSSTGSSSASTPAATPTVPMVPCLGSMPAPVSGAAAAASSPATSPTPATSSSP
ncbi:MAG: rod shape-determining protein MreC [Actinomycetota bacterium]